MLLRFSATFCRDEKVKSGKPTAGFNFNMYRFLTNHFDRLLLFVVLTLIYAGYLWTGNAPLEQILRDIVLAIFVLVGARRIPSELPTNSQTTITADSIEVASLKNETPDPNTNLEKEG